MSTISLTHEGNVSIEHLASMSTTALVVHQIVKAKGSKRYADQKRDGRSKSMSNYHAAVKCADRWCCPKGAKPHRPTNHELKLVALWDDHDGQYPFRVTVAQSAPQAVDMFIVARLATPKALPLSNRDFGAIAGYTASQSDIRWAQRNALYEGRWTPEVVTTTDEPSREPMPWERRAAQRRAAQQRRAAERLERNRQHWAKVYQRPEAEQAAKRSLTDHAVLSTATK